jgi:hypothetical protein
LKDVFELDMFRNTAEVTGSDCEETEEWPKTRKCIKVREELSEEATNLKSVLKRKVRNKKGRVRANRIKSWMIAWTEQVADDEQKMPEQLRCFMERNGLEVE